MVANVKTSAMLRIVCSFLPKYIGVCLPVSRFLTSTVRMLSSKRRRAPQKCMTPAPAEQVKLTYWIDSSGSLIRIHGPWDRWLGLDGELPDRCREAKVVGNSLFSFIEGEGVRCVYEAMHSRV